MSWTFVKPFLCPLLRVLSGVSKHSFISPQQCITGLFTYIWKLLILIFYKNLKYWNTWFELMEPLLISMPNIRTKLIKWDFLKEKKRGKLTTKQNKRKCIKEGERWALPNSKWNWLSVARILCCGRNFSGAWLVPLVLSEEQLIFLWLWIETTS